MMSHHAQLGDPSDPNAPVTILSIKHHQRHIKALSFTNGRCRKYLVTLPQRRTCRTVFTDVTAAARVFLKSVCQHGYCHVGSGPLRN